MSLSSKEAAESLAHAESTARHSARIYGYTRASPHLILWGAVWVAGYGLSDFFPAYSLLTWAILVLLGATGSFYFGHLCAKAADKNAKMTRGSWRAFGVAFIAFLFVFATYLIMEPTRDAQSAAFPALLTGTIYTSVGFWLGMRWVLTGLAVIALTLGGFFLLQEHYLLWMAFVGGGGMMLAGFWFRTA